MTRRTAPFPETAAGGFTRVDGTVQFYVRIRALLLQAPDRPTVLDFGAGRGAMAGSPTAVHRELADLRPYSRRVIGVDVDRAVHNNPLLDESHLIESGTLLPLADRSVDLIVSDHTFEHIATPDPVAAELTRVLVPGGWLCARTPSKWGYIGIGARTVPNLFHTRLLSRLQPDRQPQDIFPTAYHLNTRRDLEHYFSNDQYDHFVYGWDPEPAYAGASEMATRSFAVASRFTPERLRAVLMVFLRRRGVHC